MIKLPLLFFLDHTAAGKYDAATKQSHHRINGRPIYLLLLLLLILLFVFFLLFQ